MGSKLLAILAAFIIVASSGAAVVGYCIANGNNPDDGQVSTTYTPVPLILEESEEELPESESEQETPAEEPVVEPIVEPEEEIPAEEPEEEQPSEEPVVEPIVEPEEEPQEETPVEEPEEETPAEEPEEVIPAEEPVVEPIVEPEEEPQEEQPSEEPVVEPIVEPEEEIPAEESQEEQPSEEPVVEPIVEPEEEIPAEEPEEEQPSEEPVVEPEEVIPAEEPIVEPEEEPQEETPVEEPITEPEEEQVYDPLDAPTVDGLYAYVYGDKNLPIVVVEGNTHSSELPDCGASNFSQYLKWVSKTITDGKASFTEIDFGCAAFSVDTAVGHYVGRNLDCGSINVPMVVLCIPNNGYASIGITAKMFMFNESASLETMGSSYKLACAPMLVTEGMNEMGLTCSMLMVDNDPGSKSTSDGIFSMAMMRYLLDYAADLDDVKKIVEEVGYSSKYDSTTSIHLFITDASGNSVALECYNGKIYYAETKYVTNMYVIDTDVKIDQDSIDRYNAMVDVISPLEVVTIEDCRDALSAARGTWVGWETAWSIVFDVDNLTLNVWYYVNYDVDPAVYDINDLIAYRNKRTIEEQA